MIGQDRFSQEGFGDARAENVGDLRHLGRGVARALPHENGHARALIQHRGGARERRLRGDDARLLVADPGRDVPMLVGGLFLGLELLDVFRHNHAGDGLFSEGNAHGAVDQLPNLRRRGRHLHEGVGHVFEQRDQIHLLLVLAAEGRAILLSHDGHDRLVIHLSVVEAIEQMDGPWA